MIKKLIFLEFIAFLILTPLVFAGSYGGGIYGSGIYGENYCGDGICSNGESCSTCSDDCGSCPVSSGGGGSSCTYDWQCTEWFPSICSESGIQKRICANRGTCAGIKGMPNQTRTCEYLGPSEPLFDIYLTLKDKYKKTCSGNKIKANVKLENYAKIELLDAFMTYWIIDENNKLIAELKDTRAVEKETSFDIELKIPESTSQGIYKLYAKITYSGDKTAVAGETFEVLSQKDCVFFSSRNFNLRYLVYAGVGLFIIIFILFIIWIISRTLKTKEHRKQNTSNYRTKIRENIRRIKGSRSLLMLFSILIISSLYIGTNKITGFVTNNSSVRESNLGFVGFILIIFILGLIIFVYRKKIIEKIQYISKKYPKNSIKGLINKKVYLDNGEYLGKVKDVLLGENKIDSIKIRLDKRQKSKVKGIVINYKNIKSVGEIVILQNIPLEKISH